jgi:hypothetical protein
MKGNRAPSMRTRLTTRRTRGELWRFALAVLASVTAALWAVGCDEILGIQEALDASLETGAHHDGPSTEAPTNPDGGAPVDADAGGACIAPPNLSADCEGGLLRCTDSGSCEIDPNNDRNNCGECGRKCDGDCSGGTCAATQIDDGGWAGSRVAWAGDQQVIWIAGEKGGEQALLETLDEGGVNAVSGDDSVIADLAVEGEEDYVLENYGIDLFEWDGGQADSSIDPGYTLGPDGRITYDATHLYYTDGIDDGGVASIIKDGGGYLALAESQSHPSDLFLADGGVVFLNRATGDASNGGILLVDPTVPGTALVKVSSLGPVSELVSTHDGSAFYGLVDKGEIWRLDTATFEPHRVATWASVDHIAADATFIVFAGKPTPTSSSGIYRMQRCGGEALPVMTNAVLGPPTGLVLYGAFVYWVANGSLYRTVF